MNLNDRSLLLLEGVHPDLVRVVLRASEISPFRFIVTEGARTVEKQRSLVKAGASKTMNSRHIPENNECGLSCAVDLAYWLDSDSDGSVDSGEIRWDWPLYKQIADVMKEAAQIENVRIEWGGDWLTFKDGPHFQLPKVIYPNAR